MYLHKKNETICPHKDLYTNVYNSFVQNTQKLGNNLNVQQQVNR